MNDARIEESGNRDAGNAANAASVTGQSIGDGGSIRTDGRNKPSVDNDGRGGQGGAFPNDVVTSDVSSRRASYEITSGYYHTPSGDVRPIPEGHYIDSRDGRLKKRRKRRAGNQSDGRGEGRANYEDRDEASNGESEFSSQTDIRKPLKVRGRKKRTAKEESKKMTMLTLLAASTSALFTGVAIMTKHDHWALRTDCHPTEAAILAEAINDAIDTLPTKYYDFVTSIVEKWFPWINLCFVLCALIGERYKQSEKLFEAARYKPSNASDERYAASATQDGYGGGYSSVGFGQ